MNRLKNNVVKIIKSLLTHCGPVTPYVDTDLGRHLLRYGLQNGLLPEGTKSLPEPTLTYHQKGKMIFT